MQYIVILLGTLYQKNRCEGKYPFAIYYKYYSYFSSSVISIKSSPEKRSSDSKKYTCQYQLNRPYPFPHDPRYCL